jgi:hypothetical protein
MIPRFRDPHLDPRRWAPGGDWTPEGREEAAGRMPGFGRDYFVRLFAEMPSLREEAVFLRWSGQPDDVYAFFDLDAGGFCVQIDPDLEYIVVSAASGSSEYGDWGGNDRAGDAIAQVRSLVGRVG